MSTLRTTSPPTTSSLDSSFQGGRHDERIRHARADQHTRQIARTVHQAQVQTLPSDTKLRIPYLQPADDHERVTAAGPLGSVRTVVEPHPAASDGRGSPSLGLPTGAGGGSHRGCGQQVQPGRVSRTRRHCEQPVKLTRCPRCRSTSGCCRCGSCTAAGRCRCRCRRRRRPGTARTVRPRSCRRS